MEGIGGAASIVQLVEAAAALAHGVLYLCERLQNAAKEFHALQKEVSRLDSELESCHNAVITCHPSLLTATTVRELTSAIAEATLYLERLSRICRNVLNVQGIRSRARWVFRIRPEASRTLAELCRVREFLHHALQPLLVKGMSEALTGNEDLKNGLLTLFSDIQDLKQMQTAPSIQGGQFQSSHTTSSAQSSKRNPRAFRRLGSSPWALGSTWAIVGIAGHSIQTTQPNKRDYDTRISVSVPLTRIIGNYALSLSISIQAHYAGPWNFSLNSGFNVARVLPRNHAFFDALMRGDIADVRAKMDTGDGFISDKDDKNWKPLAFAIRSGNVELVQELLDRGANINETVGELETTPLQWAIWHKNLDITRILLKHKASQDHINLRGWNTVFFCWSRLRRGEPCMLEFLNLLAEDSYLDLDVLDALNWTALDRVAAVGTTEEVRRLIELGADPLQEAMPLRWSAIHHAVFEGNYATFDTLVSEYPDVAAMTDERGWTLLHIAASAGHNGIVRKLLELGADPYAESEPFGSHMPDSLLHRSCTPREVAAAQSPDREKQFLEAVDDVRLASSYVVVDPTLEPEEELEFCEAYEYL